MHFSKQAEIKCSPERTALGSRTQRPHAAHVRYKFLRFVGHVARSGSLCGGPCDLQSCDIRSLLSNVQPNISIQSLAPQKIEKQLHPRALLSATGFLRSRAPKVWVVSVGGPGRKELAPFRGQRSDVAGHGQGIQPR